VEKLTLAGHDPADLEKLRAIHEAGQRIQRLARDLVAYARPSGSRTEPVDLPGVVDEAARLAKPALKEHRARLETRVEPVAPVEGSRASLVQVVVNLVTNAAQAARDGGTVRVTLGPEGERVLLSVEDDGPGMAADVAARAFEPFFTTRPATGIGLGLPIVQGIVERHGGTVSVETAAGEGTRVRVRLPVKPR
jgi:signal transduction histidine kinase